MMGGKGEPEEAPAGAAEWLVTYSDMVTLMLTFFVLLFAMSNVDAQKFKLVATAFKSGGITVEEFNEIRQDYEIWEGESLADLSEITLPGPENDPGTNESLDELHTQVEDYIQFNDLADSISLVHNGDHLLMTLTSDIWFASGRADITPSMLQSATILGAMLSDIQDDANPFEVVVVGHTDNRPINTPEFPNNWYLSAERSLNFLGVLLEGTDLDPNRFSSRGCGEYSPIATNDTDEGRQLNRRVEVLISQAHTNPNR